MTSSHPGDVDGQWEDPDDPYVMARVERDLLGRPEIVVTNEHLRDLSDQALASLDSGFAGDVFVHGTAISRVRGDVEPPHLEALNHAALRGVLARAADWMNRTRDGALQPTAPPTTVVNDLMSLPALGLRPLDRLISAPALRRDGTLRMSQGYDAASRTFLVDTGLDIPPVPDRPNGAQVAWASDVLTGELLGELPFVGKPERAHALALVLLPFVRDLVGGPTPLHLVEAPSPGTGKSLLVQAALIPALGDAVGFMTEGRDEDEWRKRLTATLLKAPVAVVVDNLRSPLESSALASALTTHTWEDRMLGQSRLVSVPVTTLWAATGNNPALSNEIARRSVRIRLDSGDGCPWLRKDFRHPALLGWARVNRSLLVWAALVLARAWIVDGMPRGTARLGMFESWSEVMGGILDVAGVEGFLGNLEEFYDTADSETTAWTAVVEAWWSEHRSGQVGVAQLFGLVGRVAPDLLGAGGNQAQRTRLGRLLQSARDWRIGPYMIRTAGKWQGAVQYRLEIVEGPADRRSSAAGHREAGDPGELPTTTAADGSFDPFDDHGADEGHEAHRAHSDRVLGPEELAELFDAELVDHDAHAHHNAPTTSWWTGRPRSSHHPFPTSEKR